MTEAIHSDWTDPDDEGFTGFKSITYTWPAWAESTLDRKPPRRAPRMVQRIINPWVSRLAEWSGVADDW